MYYYSLHYPQMLLGCCSVIYMITVYDPILPYRIAFDATCLSISAPRHNALIFIETLSVTYVSDSCLNVCEHYSHICASCIT